MSWNEDSSNEGESFDVLLQLTFPMVLILAFVVFTQVRALEENLKEVEAQLIGTETGKLREKLDLAIIELQKQLLTKAVEEVIVEEQTASGLDEYASLVPTPDAVISGQMGSRYPSLSYQLYNRFNRPATTVKPELKRRVEVRYQALAAEHVVLQSEPISEANGLFLETELDGNISKLIDRIVAIQRQGISRWLSSPSADQVSKSESERSWIQLILGSNDPTVTDRRNRFNNVTLEKLKEILNKAGAPMLDRTLEGVL